MNTKIWYRILLVGLLLFVGGLLYGFAGHQEENGSIHLLGMIYIAALFPWEILFFGKSNNKHKK